MESNLILNDDGKLELMGNYLIAHIPNIELGSNNGGTINIKGIVSIQGDLTIQNMNLLSVIKALQNTIDELTGKVKALENR